MLGAIVGDIVGSRFEWHNNKSKDFDFFSDDCYFTDDTVMTLAIANAFLNCREDFSDLQEKCIEQMVKIGRKYPHCGFGGHFRQWVLSDNHEPYNSFGNGSAMRVSACGFAAKSIDEAIKLSKEVTKISHNHPEGLKGAESVAVAIYMAREGKSLDEIKDYITKNYYNIDFCLDDIRDNYTFDVTCQGSVPQAFEAFFESSSFEDAIRNAISIGGDSDTIGAIVGGMAEAYYGVPNNLREKAIEYLPDEFINIINRFEEKY